MVAKGLNTKSMGSKSSDFTLVQKALNLPGYTHFVISTALTKKKINLFEVDYVSIFQPVATH